MRIAWLHTDTIYSSWSMLAIGKTLRQLGHEVIEFAAPCDYWGRPRTEFRPLEYKRLMASLPKASDYDMVLVVGPEYIPHWLNLMDWHKCPIRVAIFLESSKRAVGNYGEMAPHFTHCFYPDPEDAKTRGGFYIQPWVDTDVFRPDANTPKTWDAGFVGSLYPKRMEFLNKLMPLIPEVDFRVGGVEVRDLEGERQEDWAELLANNIRRLKIHVNLPSNNPMTVSRVLETMACGTCCLTYKPNDDLLEDGKDLLYYSSPEECAENLLWLIEHEVWREQMASYGLRTARSQFSLKLRLDELLQQVIS